MTPFDPVALVAMLLAFYPVVSGSELARARRERPEYFAGGTLGGSHGDKLTLPDAACWDCIFASGTNDPLLMRWQCVPCGTGAGDDPRYPLEAGPLVPVDLAQWPEPTPGPVFGPLTADGLSGVASVDDTLHRAGVTVTEQSSPARLEASFGNTLGDADGRLTGELAAVATTAPDDVYGATVSHGGAIDTNAAVFDEPVPPDIPTPPGLPPDVPQPGPPPPVPSPPDVG